MQIEPFGDRVIIRRDTEEVDDKLRHGDLELWKAPSQVRAETSTKCRGELLAIGPECKYAKQGDHVIYFKYSENQGYALNETDFVAGEENLLGRIVTPD